MLVRSHINKKTQRKAAATILKSGWSKEAWRSITNPREQFKTIEPLNLYINLGINSPGDSIGLRSAPTCRSLFGRISCPLSADSDSLGKRNTLHQTLFSAALYVEHHRHS